MSVPRLGRGEPARPWQTEAYRRYLRSPAWKLRRAQALLSAQFHCERCVRPGLYDVKLQVHHKHYRSLGREQDADLEVLCEDCHERADHARANAAASETIYAARLDGWATKVYGDDWWYYRDEASVAEEFDAWLDERSDE